MTTKEKLLLESKAWTQEKLLHDREYFKKLDALSSPEIFWLASTDSLVPVQELINAEPGDVLVHSNIGIQVHPDDHSLIAILEKAVAILGVKYIVVCGYSHCSGVESVLQQKSEPPATEAWLRNLHTLYQNNRHELDAMPYPQREKQLNELNIREQVKNMSKLPVIQKAWEKTDYPQIFGWYFDLQAGALKEVFSLENNHKLKQVASLVESA